MGEEFASSPGGRTSPARAMLPVAGHTGQVAKNGGGGGPVLAQQLSQGVSITLLRVMVSILETRTPVILS